MGKIPGHLSHPFLGERNEFERQNAKMQSAHEQLQSDFDAFQQSPSNERRAEQVRQLSKRLDDVDHDLEELLSVQCLLIGQGHRIDSRIDGQLDVQVKHLDGQIHNEIERIERVLQTENDFHHLEKEFDAYLQSALAQFQASSHQVRPSPCASLNDHVL